jgi:N-acetylglucosaminyl-diphospho-decaprenol L-rhamnosyltransferase
MIGGEGAGTRVAVVIVSYNSAETLEGALASLDAMPASVRLDAVVVADNASADASVKLAESFTGLPVRIVQTGHNAGYAAAFNAGTAVLELGALDAVLIMNPDCRLRPDTLARLAADLRRPRCGIAVPRLVNLDGTLQPSLRRSPTLGRALVEAVIGGKVAGRIGGLGELITDPKRYEQAGPTVWATGAAMLISTRVLADLGPWDESFFLFSEETEYCLRAADHGYQIWFNPEAVAVHIGGEAGVNPNLAALTVVNKVRLYRRRHGAVASSAFYLATLAGEAVRALAGRRISRAAVAGLLHGTRSRYAIHQVLGRPAIRSGT